MRINRTTITDFYVVHWAINYTLTQYVDLVGCLACVVTWPNFILIVINMSRKFKPDFFRAYQDVLRHQFQKLLLVQSTFFVLLQRKKQRPSQENAKFL